jgi:hypothetical protein
VPKLSQNTITTALENSQCNGSIARPGAWGHVSDPSGGGAFDSDVTHAMSTAFAEVCDALGVAETNKAAREKIALPIIDIARRGERGPDRLRDRVLRAVR